MKDLSEAGARFMRLQAAPAYQLVATAIEEEIVSGRIRPGEALGTEAKLVQQFGVNRSTVREGIRLLEQSGLVRRESGRRLFACLPEKEHLSRRMSYTLFLYAVNFQEVWEATSALEIAAVELAAQRATDENIAVIADNVERSFLTDDPETLSQLDMEFHALIANASGNRALQLARDAVGQLCFSSVSVILRDVPPAIGRLREAHRNILSALQSRDPEVARVWMRRHVKDWRGGYEKSGRDVERPIDWADTSGMFTRGNAGRR